MTTTVLRDSNAPRAPMGWLFNSCARKNVPRGANRPERPTSILWWIHAVESWIRGGFAPLELSRSSTAAFPCLNARVSLSISETCPDVAPASCSKAQRGFPSSVGARLGAAIQVGSGEQRGKWLNRIRLWKHGNLRFNGVEDVHRLSFPVSATATLTTRVPHVRASVMRRACAALLLSQLRKRSAH